MVTQTKTRKTVRSTKTKPKTSSTTRRKRPGSSLELEAHIRAVLEELMCTSESDSVRVAAAKALMDRLRLSDAADDEHDKRSDRNEQAELLSEARELLAAFVEAKSGGARGQVQVDPDGKA